MQNYIFPNFVEFLKSDRSLSFDGIEFKILRPNTVDEKDFEKNLKIVKLLEACF